MVTLSELSYDIKANTEGLNKALPAIEKLAKSLENLLKTVEGVGEKSSSSMKRTAAATEQAASTSSKAASKTADSWKKMQAAALAAEQKMLSANKAILTTGQGFKQTAGFARANEVALVKLVKVLQDSSKSTNDIRLAQAQFNKTLQENARTATGLNRVNDISAKNRKAEEAAMIRQEKAVNRLQIKYENLRKTLEGNTKTKGFVKDLDLAFKGLQTGMRTQGGKAAAGLSNKDFNAVQDTFLKRMGDTRRAAEIAAPGISKFNQRMQDLSKSVQVALGPLSGVASRITAFTALVNKNTFALAGLIAGVIGFGHMMTRVIGIGAEYEKQMFRIQAVLDATGKSAEFSANEIDQMARRVGKATMTTQREARNAAATLLTIPNINKEIFETALMAAQGMALIGRGTIESQARRIGQLLQDPVNNLKALTEAGLRFTTVEEEMIKNFDALGNRAGVLEIIKRRLDVLIDAASGETAGLAGSWDTFLETITDFAIQVSEASGATKILADLTNFLTTTIANLDDRTSAAWATAKVLGTVLRGLANSIKFVINNAEIFIAILEGLVIYKFLKGVQALAMGLKGLAVSFGIAEVAAKAFGVSLDVAMRKAGAAMAILSAVMYLDQARQAMLEKYSGQNQEQNNLRLKFSTTFEGIDERDSDFGSSKITKKIQESFSNLAKTLGKEGFEKYLESLGKTKQEIKELSDSIFSSGESLDVMQAKLLETVTSVDDFSGKTRDAYRTLGGFKTRLEAVGKEAFAQVLKDSGLAAQAIERTIFILEKLTDPLDKVVSSLKDEAIAQKENTAIAFSSGEARKNLTIEQELLNKAIEAGIYLNYEDALSQRKLTEEQEKTLQVMRDLIAAKQQDAAIAERASSIKEAQRALDVQKEQVRVMFMTEGAQKRYLELQQKIYELNQLAVPQEWKDYELYLMRAKHANEEFIESLRPIQTAFDAVFDGATEAFMEFVTTGKVGIRELLDSIAVEITKAAFEESIIKPLKNFLGGKMNFSGGLFGGAAAKPLGELGTAANPMWVRWWGAGALGTGAASTTAVNPFWSGGAAPGAGTGAILGAGAGTGAVAGAVLGGSIFNKAGGGTIDFSIADDAVQSFLGGSIFNKAGGGTIDFSIADEITKALPLIGGSAGTVGFNNTSPTLNLSASDFDLLTRTAYAETDWRNAPELAWDQYFKNTDTILNRVVSDRYPNTVAGVVNQPLQFSPVNPFLKQGGAINLPPASIEAQARAMGYLQQGQGGILTSGATHFLNPSVAGNAPWYRNGFSQTTTAGSGVYGHVYGNTFDSPAVNPYNINFGGSGGQINLDPSGMFSQGAGIDFSSLNTSMEQLNTTVTNLTPSFENFNQPLLEASTNLTGFNSGTLTASNDLQSISSAASSTSSGFAMAGVGATTLGAQTQVAGQQSQVAGTQVAQMGNQAQAAGTKLGGMGGGGGGMGGGMGLFGMILGFGMTALMGTLSDKKKEDDSETKLEKFLREEDEASMEGKGTRFGYDWFNSRGMIPKYHEGSVPNDMMAILEKSEKVFSKGEYQNMMRLFNNGASSLKPNEMKTLLKKGDIVLTGENMQALRERMMMEFLPRLHSGLAPADVYGAMDTSGGMNSYGKAQINAASGGSSQGNSPYSVNVTIQTPDPEAFKYSRGQIESMMASAINRGSNRNG